MEYPIRVEKFEIDDEWHIINEGCGCCEEDEIVTENSKKDLERLEKYLNEQLEQTYYLMETKLKENHIQK